MIKLGTVGATAVELGHIEKRLAPTLSAVRESDLLVVHCPPPDVAPADPAFPGSNPSPAERTTTTL
jgi:hypothetical protein